MQQVKSDIHIVGICGSLRKQSYNRGLLRAFREQLPENIKFTLADISELPFYNQDNEQPFPETVLRLKEILVTADALVISSPEYNLSFTGVLKNAIEWISRRALETNLAGKPVAIIGAASIKVGTSQSHLRDVMWGLNMRVLNRPIIQVDRAQEKFDKEGNLTDEGTKELLGNLKDELINVIKK